MEVLAPARPISHNGYTGFANEVGPHNPRLQKRYYTNPVAIWAGQYLEGDDRHPTPELHLDLWDMMMKENRAAITAPRSFAKTTCCRNFILFCICEHENIKAGKYASHGLTYAYCRIRFMSCAGDKAREILTQIRDELSENILIKTDYGEFNPKMSDGDEYTVEGKVWTEKRLKTKNGVEVSAAGRGAQVRGFRPDLLILDDLDEDEEVLSDERMEKAFKWFDTAVYNTIDEDEYKVFCIGTILEEVSILNYIAEKPSFKHIVFRAYEENLQQEGWEVWPSKWPHKKLQNRLADIGWRAFMSEFQALPQPSDNPLFERNWFREYNPVSQDFLNLLNQTLYSFFWIDPAISKKDGSDYSAIVTVSVTYEHVPRIFLRSGGVLRGHWTPNEILRKGIHTYDAFYCHEMGIETTAYQEALKYLFDDEEEKTRRSFSIREVKPVVDKERRANAVSPMVQRGQVYYDPNDPMHVKLIDECVLFKPGKLNIKKDLMDAFVYCLTRTKEWSASHTDDSESCNVLPGGRSPHARTGV